MLTERTRKRRGKRARPGDLEPGADVSPQRADAASKGGPEVYQAADNPQRARLLLSLQRSRGNAYVARMMARTASPAPARRRAPAVTDPGASQTPAAISEAPAQEPQTPGYVSSAPPQAAASAGTGAPAIQRLTVQRQATAEELATEIYDALNWSNDVPAAMSALRRAHANRYEVQSAFSAENGSIWEYLKDQLSTEDVIDAYANLIHGHTHDLHVGLAKAILPVGTRDDEIHRLLRSVPAANRAQLAEQYEADYNDLGEGTLRADLISDQSSWELQKSLSLLDHETTAAEHLYFDSVAITGTNTTSVIERLQGIAAANDPNAFAKLEEEWNNYVKSSDGWNTSPPEPFTEMDIREAMESELSGEDAGFAITAIDQGRQRGSGAAGAVPEGMEGGAEGAATMNEEQVYADEQIRLDMHMAYIRSAADNLGTNEAQIYAAVEAIREIWSTRIRRAEAGANEGVAADYRRQWEAAREEIRPIVNDEMDEEGLENLRVRLLLSGPLQPVDEYYLATTDYDHEAAVDIITKAWASGGIETLLASARDPKLDSEGRVLRPAYAPVHAMSATTGEPFIRTAILMNSDYGDIEKGARRLKFEFDEGTADSDCASALKFLQTPGLAADRRDQVIANFVSIQNLSGRDETTDTRKFLGWVSERYEESTSTWEMRDYLDPASTPEQLLERAEGRHAAAHSGLLDDVVTDWARDWGHLTGEDTVEIEQESLERLRFIVGNTSPEELQGMLALTGKATVGELAQFQYDEYRARLDELRALKAAIAEGLAAAVEIVAAAALTVATGGAASGALAVAIGSAISGMIARELLLGTEYELFSEENAKQLIIAAATAGVGASLGPAIQGLDKIKDLGKAGGFIAGALTEGAKSVTSSTLTVALSDGKLTEDAFADIVVRSVGSMLGGGLSSSMTVGLDDIPIKERILPTIQSQVMGNIVSGTADEVAAATGQGDVTAGDIVSRLALRFTRSIGEGTIGALGEVGGAAVGAARERGAGGEGDAAAAELGAAEGGPAAVGDESEAPTEPAQPASPEAQVDSGGGGGGGNRDHGNDGGGGGGEGGGGGPFEGLTDAEIEAAVGVFGPSGTMVEGSGAAGETAQALIDVEVVSRLNDEVRALVAGRGLAESPEGAAFERSQSEVELAARILENPLSTPQAINQALQVIVERAVGDYRALRTEELAGRGRSGLTSDNLRGMCGEGRDITADSISALTIGSQSPVIIHRIQASHLGIGAQHAFTVIILQDGSGFLVDPTFAQFADQISGDTYTSEAMLSDPRAVRAARDLLRDGFVPLTTDNARDYALGLSARPDQAEAVAAQIVAGDASVLTELVVDGEVTRASTRPGEAANTLLLPNDPDEPGLGSIHAIEAMLARMQPDDPARPLLASLRDRLIMIDALQPRVEGDITDEEPEIP